MNKAVLSEPARYRDFWQWPTSSKLLLAADEYGFDHQVQYGRWSGYGGESGWNDASLEFAAAGAASGAITHNIGINTTVHTNLAYHPMHIAKFGVTLDHITQGRWGINIVAGANQSDFRQFGITTMESSSERYARADEFVTLLKYLWTSEEPVDFDGQYYQAYGASLGLRSTRQPRPVIMNAGQSGPGLDFACRQADWVFVAPPSGRIEDYATMVEEVHQLAEKYRRKVRVAAMCYAVIEDSDAEAEETIAWLESRVDRDAVFNFVHSSGGTTTTSGLAADADDPYAGIGREKFLRIGLGLTGHQLFGSHETVAEKLQQLHSIGVENAAVCFWDPIRGVKQMGEKIIPILQRMGLRKASPKREDREA